MPIKVQRFSGMVPKVDSESLGDGAAQLAKNCDITSGSIGPINAQGPFVSMHNDDGSMKSTLPVADLVTIAKPSTPTVIDRERICDPTQWLQMVAHDYVTYIDGTTGEHVITSWRGAILPMDSFEYTETGLIIRYTLPLFTYTMGEGGPYNLYGPRYQFRFLSDSAHDHGGPDQQFTIPKNPSYSDPEISAISVPLIDENENLYATFQITDVEGPNFDESYVVAAGDPTIYPQTSGEVAFKIDLNYTEPRRKHYYFVASGVDTEDREGPPSEVGDDPVVVKPGERVTLQTTRPTGAAKTRLYRSSTGGDDFLLVDEYEADSYTLEKTTTRTETIPPFGNHPSTQDDFIIGAQIHPAHIGVSVHENTLYLSDPYRLHAWPEENTVPFTETIKAFAITGNSILVFAGDNVYSVYGNNPEFMGKSLLSETSPLLNTKGLCRIGNSVFWPTHDGLAVSTGSSVDLVSKNHFTRQQWLEFNPDMMEATTADNSIHLAMGDPVVPDIFSQSRFALQIPVLGEGETIENLRFDIEESDAAVSVYTALSGVSYTWRSKTYRFDQPTVFDAVKIACDGATNLTLYADGVTHGPFSVTDDAPLVLDGLPHARIWDFSLSGSSQVRDITLYDRVIPTIDKMITLNPESVATWERFYVKFPDRGRFAGGILSCQGSAPVDIKFYADDDLVTTQEVTNGHPFRIPRGMKKSAVWRMEIDTDQRVDELVLYDTRNVAVGSEITRVNDGFPSWLYERYQISDETSLRTMKVMSDSPVEMNVYLNGAIEPTQTYQMLPGIEQRLTGLDHAETVEFNFSDVDHAVRVAQVYLQTPFVMNGPFQLQNSPVWRGSVLHFPDTGRIRCARVRGVGLDDATLTLYRDGTAVDSYDVTDGEMIVFDPTLAEAQRWEVDLQSENADVHELIVIPEQDRDAPYPIGIRPGDAIKPWLHSRFNFMDRQELTSLKVQATSYPVYMRIYMDDDSAPVKKLKIDDGYERIIRGLDPSQSIRFDFRGDDDLVREVYLYGRNPVPFPLSGYFIDSHAKPTRRRYLTFEDRNRPAVARIQASGYENNNVTLRLRTGGVEVYDELVPDNKPFMLPRTLPKDVIWGTDVEVTNEHKAELIQLIPKSLVAMREHEVNRGAIPAWMKSIYSLGGEKAVTGVQVHSDEYPVTMNLYIDEEEAPSRILVINDDSYVALTEQISGNFLEYDFGGDDYKVNEVFVLQPQTMNVGSNAVTLQNKGVWGSYRFLFVDQGAFACGMVDAESYPVTLSLTVDGGTTTEITVSDERPFLFPRTEGTVWEVQMSGSGTIHSAILQPWVNRQVSTVITAEYPASGFAPWLYTRWQIPKDFRITAIRGLCSGTVPVTLYADRSVTSTDTDSIVAGKSTLIDGSKTAELDFNFDGQDDEVQRVWVSLEDEKLVHGPPITLSGRDSWRMMRFHFPDSGKFACIKVSSKTYSGLYISIYNDGQRVYSKALSNDKPIILPKSLSSANRWEVDLYGVEESEIENVVIYPLRREIVQDQNRIRAIRQDGKVPEWYYTEYELNPNSTVRSAMVAGEATSIDVYVNGASSKKRVGLRDGKENRFNSFFDAHYIRFDFAGNDEDIRDAYIFLEDHVPVENTGVVLRHTPSHGWQNKVLAFSDTGAFSVARIVATDYTGMTLKLQSDSESLTVDVDDANEFKLPKLNPAKSWQLFVTHEGQIREIQLFTTDRRKADEKGIVFQRGQQPHTWLDRRFYCSKPTSFTLARIVAEEYPVRMNVRNGEDSIEVIALDEKPVRLPRVRPEIEWAFDVISDTVVHEVAIGTSMEGLRNG